LGVIGAGILLNPLNSSMMAVAVVDMQPVFDVDFREASLLISVFYVTSAVGQPVMGRFADRFGRKRLFLTGLVVVVVASAAAPFSPSFGWLLATRVLQALGSSTLFPAGLGILHEVISDERARALSVVGIFAGLAAAVGPLVGGALVSTVDWYAVFAINAPICVVVFMLAWYVLPWDVRQHPRRARGVRESIETFDVVGVVLFGVALVSTLWFLLSVPETPTWWLLATGVAAGGLFVRRELRAQDPVVDLAALRANPALVSIYAQFTMVNVIFYAVIFGVPSYLQAKGVDPVTAGLVLLPLSGVSVLILPVAARVIDRFGPGWPLCAGAVVMIGASLLLLGVNSVTTLTTVVLAVVLFGMANGVSNIGLQAALYRVAPSQEMSAAAGLLQTSRYLGTILSTIVLAIAFSHSITATELHAVALVLAAVAAAALLLAWRQRAEGYAG
jgi:MFS family permease